MKPKKRIPKKERHEKLKAYLLENLFATDEELAQRFGLFRLFMTTCNRYAKSGKE